MKTEANLNLLCKTTSSETDGDKLKITGLASSTSQDLDGESVSYKALQQMYYKVRGLSLFLEHQHHLESVIGTIVDAELKGTELYITAEILDSHKDFVKGLLDSNVNVGFSIGGIATFNKEDKSLMEDFNLLEVSLVSLPANWDSYGTVVEEKSVTCTCLHAGLHKLKNMGGKSMDNKDYKEVEAVEPTAEEVIKSEAIVEEPVEKAEEAIEETEEAIVAEEKSEEISEPEEVVEEAAPEIEEKSEDIEVEEKEDAPRFLTADDIGAILESYMAEKEEQITANVLAAIQTQLEKKAADVEEAEEEKSISEEEEIEEKSEEVVEEKAVEPVSKYAAYSEEQTTETKTFLGSEERDYLGRNIKYL